MLRNYLWVVIMLITFASCDKCESVEPRYIVQFVDAQSGQEVQQQFLSVVEIYESVNLNFNQNKELPLNLNSDSVSFVFEYKRGAEILKDTVTLKYSRDLDYAGGNYCMRFKNEHVAYNSFDQNINLDSRNYEITITY
jgi:hypothetical protein